MQWSLRIRDENLGTETSGRSKLLEAQKKWQGGGDAGGVGGGGGGVGVPYRKEVPIAKKVGGPAREL